MAHVAIAMGIVLNRPRRKLNIYRQAYVTNEEDFAALRLDQHEVHQLALEYVRRHVHVHGSRMGYHTSIKRMKVFLHYIARGSYYHQLGRAEGIAKSTVIAYLHDVSAFFQQTSVQ